MQFQSPSALNSDVVTARQRISAGDRATYAADVSTQERHTRHSTEKMTLEPAARAAQVSISQPGRGHQSDGAT